MENPPPPVNKAADAVNAIIKNANSQGIKFVEALIIAEIPILGLPVLKWILGFLLSWIDGYISKAEQTGATFMIIDTQVTLQKTAVTKALAALLVAQKLGDPDAIKKAIKAYADANSALVHYDGPGTISK